VHGVGDEQPPQDVTGVGVNLNLQIGDGEGDHQVVHDVLRDPKSHGGENPSRVTPQHLDDAVQPALICSASCWASTKIGASLTLVRM
jgi:hypothetical protein